jgi:hypothetical protein
MIMKWTSVAGTMATTLGAEAPRTNLIRIVSWKRMFMVSRLPVCDSAHGGFSLRLSVIYRIHKRIRSAHSWAMRFGGAGQSARREAPSAMVAKPKDAKRLARWVRRAVLLE